MALKICLLLLACATVGLAQILGNVPGPDLGPTYTLQTFINPNLNEMNRTQIMTRINLTSISNLEVHYEWENYDGWYNNPAHPEWGGAGKLHCAKELWKLVLYVCANYACEYLFCKYACK